MSQEFPSLSKKELPDQELIDALHSHGPKDPATRTMLDSWVRVTEREFNENPESVSRIEMNIRRGRLFFVAGYIDEAYDSLSAAATQADNEGKTELYASIIAEMDEMDTKL
ncbi:MAG: hypothetical protein UW46_C0004G0025 [Candidatus Yanofskybacteria bacterium GW2011_GWF1_44_227]|nr:MAG: hypothetical protein UV97_C0010G0002 [Candidatus Yanofskybacteria bacterium GW2011_GWF2_43_596]KKT53298.1 MAG: hypothetical protein UW46_C0004G0025 [Candidatus Yanofskybacteria bacterium GW2011_GWF1_44_227]OGN35931.1 MAG: hypothetical protein A2207_02625 [Candidatus Yanofskybacteria bacterium RIFOXYA1_FULL_44_17]OGN36467.1 MAG: hypothetical protein A2241_01860 [Candidatus Yanofskybacteria bacterium RIFOXYA2_FULL_45_28]OGN37352.1 MAG: hypothetical protein A2371_00075 [Candidatus Yanofsky